MNLFLMFPIVATPICLIIIGGAYIWFKKGIAPRIFTILIPLLAWSAYAGWIACMKPGWIRLSIAGIVDGAVCVPVLYYFFRTVVTPLKAQTSTIAASTAQIASTAAQQASTAYEQSSTVAQIVTTINEVDQTSRTAASSAQNVLTVVTKAAEKGVQGAEAVAEALRIMRLISGVVEVVESVNSLAERLNLLAFNAGIEAAKAGEYGRGFGVVALEVRNLAEQSKNATTQIRTAIRRVKEGQDAMASIEMIIRELSTVLEGNADSAQQISATTTQQTAGIQQISEAIKNVSQGGKDTAEAARQLESAVSTLNQVVGDLKVFVSG